MFEIDLWELYNSKQSTGDRVHLFHFDLFKKSNWIKSFLFHSIEIEIENESHDFWIILWLKYYIWTNNFGNNSLGTVHLKLFNIFSKSCLIPFTWPMSHDSCGMLTLTDTWNIWNNGNSCYLNYLILSESWTWTLSLKTNVHLSRNNFKNSEKF